MTELFTVEDLDNVRVILCHHLGNPMGRDDDGKTLGLLAQEPFWDLAHDLLRYCTRLRCQPQTDAHTDAQGYQVPAHQLIAMTADDVDHLAQELWKDNRSGSWAAPRRWEDLSPIVHDYWRERARQTHVGSH